LNATKSSGNLVGLDVLIAATGADSSVLALTSMLVVTLAVAQPEGIHRMNTNGEARRLL
jgi:hypothetical protein